MICLTRNDLNPLMMAVEASASTILVCNPFLSSSPTTTYKAVALQKSPASCRLAQPGRNTYRNRLQPRHRLRCDYWIPPSGLKPYSRPESQGTKTYPTTPLSPCSGAPPLGSPIVLQYLQLEAIWIKISVLFKNLLTPRSRCSLRMSANHFMICIQSCDTK